MGTFCSTMFRLKTANYLFILIISIEASVWIASALEPTEASIQHDRMISTLTSTSNLDPTQEKTFESSVVESALAVVPARWLILSNAQEGPARRVEHRK